jgi:excisionase family DNA binding protein
MSRRELVRLPQAVEARPWTSERLLRRLVAERRIPFHKVAGRLLFDLADLDAFAEAGRVEPPTVQHLRRTG